MSRLRLAATYVLPVTAFIAVFGMMFHATAFTRQVDVQHIEYAFRFLKEMYEGTPGEYLLHPQKYPLLSVVPLSFLYGLTLIGLRLVGTLPSFGQHDIEMYLFTDPTAINLVTRFAVFATAILSCVLIYASCKKVAPKANPIFAVLLMLSSMLFLTFASSMRPHTPEVMLTMAAFYFSFRFYETRFFRHEFLAFGSALAAFCMLQNGIFAFVFPVWATLFDQGKIKLGNLRSIRLWVWLVLCGVLALLLGYPFLVKQLFFDRVFDPGLGNEAIGKTAWTPQGFTVLARTLIDSETFPFLFGILGFWRFRKGKNPLHPFFLGAALYCAVYALFFGFVADATPRYFFPLMPFLAILGAEALQSSRFLVPYAAFVLLVHAKLLSFALLPDVYDLSHDFLVKTPGSIATVEPHYFLGIPPTRASIETPSMEKERFIASLSEDLPGARDFVPFNEAARADIVVSNPWSTPALPNTFVECANFTSVPRHDRMFLWSEVEWSYYWLFQTKRMGPGIVIHCRK